MDDTYDHLVKILMVGESGVGKTCIIRRFTKNEFSLAHLSTIAIDFKMKIVQINDEKLKFQIWDTAGQERFNTLTAGFFKGSDGVIVTYSVTDRQSFNNVDKWVSQIKTLAPEDVQIVLVGNKIDMKAERQISLEEGQQLAQKYGYVYIETSAKTGENVDSVFDKMGNMVLEKIKQNPNNDFEDDDLLKNQNKKKIKNCCKQIIIFLTAFIQLHNFLISLLLMCFLGNCNFHFFLNYCTYLQKQFFLFFLKCQINPFVSRMIFSLFNSPLLFNEH